MSRKRPTPEQVIRLVREAEVMISKGMPTVKRPSSRWPTTRSPAADLLAKQAIRRRMRTVSLRANGESRIEKTPQAPEIQELVEALWGQWRGWDSIRPEWPISFKRLYL